MERSAQSEMPEAGVPPLGDVSYAMLRRAIACGGRDLCAAPGFAIVFAGFYVMSGLVMAWVTLATGQSYWLVLAAIGFPLIAPFAAVGFYEVSRRFDRGLVMDWHSVLGVILRQSGRQLPSLCAVIVILFLFGFFLAHMIFALFLGLSPMTNVSSSVEVFLSGKGLAMLAVGVLVGAGFSALLFMITVIALPLLLDREVDFVTAMITSFHYVAAHPLVMFSWAAFIAAVTLVSLLPGFLGLFVTLPVLGHATWHLYAELSAPEAGRDGRPSPKRPQRREGRSGLV